MDDLLVLNKIRFAEEIRDQRTKDPRYQSKPNEMKMAHGADRSVAGRFEIEKYKDTYSDQLMELIEAKAKGKRIKAPTMKVVHSKSRDLMEQLKASLSTTTKRKAS